MLPSRCADACDAARLRGLIDAFLGSDLAKKNFAFGGVFPAADSDLAEVSARLSSNANELTEIALLDGAQPSARRRHRVRR